jgi:hypothetical protein
VTSVDDPMDQADREHIRRAIAAVNGVLLTDMERLMETEPDLKVRFAAYRNQLAVPGHEIDPDVLALFHSEVLAMLVRILVRQAAA